MNDNDTRGYADDEKEIDLLELAAKLWENRRKLIIWSVCGAVIGLIVAFSIPREYTTEVTLAPESTDRKAMGSLGGMASMLGINMGGAAGADAVNPMLYPDVVKSVPFATSLFDVVVENKEGEKCTVRQFIEDDTKAPWWGYLMGLPGKIIGAIKGGPDEEDAKGKKIDNFKLSQTESNLVGALNQRITASVDQKTSVITINVQMQDPMVSAILADTVVARLRDYITNYRTNKARRDLEYAQKINEEAKENYYKAQQAYADYQDRNQGIILQSARTTSERLQNEADLAFNVFNQTSQQVQAALMKVQETTPVYTTVNPATVPLKPSSPKKLLILVGFTFLAFVACAAWILFGKPLLEEQRAKKRNGEAAS